MISSNVVPLGLELTPTRIFTTQKVLKTIKTIKIVNGNIEELRWEADKKVTKIVYACKETDKVPSCNVSVVKSQPRLNFERSLLCG